MNSGGASAQSSRLTRAARALARDETRRERVARRERNPAEGAAILADLAAETAKLTRIHCIRYAPRDWGEVLARGPVEVPRRTHLNQLAARKALMAYRPSWFERMFGTDGDRRRLLVAKVAEAASQDEQAFRAAYKIAAAHNAEFEAAQKLMRLEPAAIQRSLTELTTFREIGPAVDGVRLHIPARGRLVGLVSALDFEDTPNEVGEAVDGGRPRFRPAPFGRRQTIYRAHVCSAALRVAAEFLSASPIDMVEIQVEADVLQPDTQEARRAQVLILKATHAAMATLDLERCDPVRAVLEMSGAMKWTADAGFQAMEGSNVGVAA